MKCTYEIINLAKDVIDEKKEDLIRKVYDALCESISTTLTISELDFEEQIKIFDMTMDSNVDGYLKQFDESELDEMKVNYDSNSKEILFLFGKDGSLTIKFDLSE